MRADMLDREAELAQARELVDRAMGGRGSVLVIEGPPGIGKTRLLREIATAAEPSSLVLAARGSRLERGFAFGLIRQCVDPLLERMAAEEREQLLDGVVAPARRALGLLPVTDEPPDVHGILNGLYWMLVRLAARRPLLLALDDIHWADEATVALVSFLARRVESVPLLMVVTARPRAEQAVEAHLAELVVEPTVSVIRPAALSEEALGALLADGLAHEPEPEFTHACLELTGGVPFLVLEVVRALRERGLEPTARERCRLASLSPANVERSVAGRLAAAAAGAQSLARAIAVLGDGCTATTAAELARLDEAEALQAVDALTRAGLLAREPPLGFAHPLLRTAVESQISAAERARMHGRAARLLIGRDAPAERVALHLLETEPAGDARAARILAEAGRRALARGAPETAVRLLYRAVAEPPPHHERHQHLLDLGSAEAELGLAAARAHLRTVAEEAGDERLRVSALARLDLAWITGPRPDTQHDLLPIYERLIAGVLPRDREAALNLEAARLGLLFIIDERAVEFSQAAARFRDLRGETPAESAVLAWVARDALMSGATAAAVGAIVERAARQAALAVAGASAPWFLHLVFCMIAAERLATAESLATRALEVAVDGGSPGRFASASTLRAFVRHAAGDLRGAEADARGAIESGGLGGFYRLQPLIPLCESLADQGRISEAKAMLAEHRASGELPAARPYTALLIARGRLRFAAGEMQAARHDLHEALARLDASGSGGVIGLDARLETALVEHALRNDAAARRAADESLELARAWDGRRALGGALRVAGMVRGGDAGIDMLREAASTLEGSPARLWQALALADLGAALRRANHRRECRPPLRAAVELADSCGATPLAERARHELAASGGRVPPRTGGRFDQLTASELRVARLASTGLSNPEIAQRLFVTIKTVEGHLSNVYRKLHIGSRRELVQALEPTVPDGRPC